MFSSFQSFTVPYSFPLRLNATKLSIENISKSTLDLLWRRQKYSNNSSDSHLSLKAYHVYSKLKHRGNDCFKVKYTWCVCFVVHSADLRFEVNNLYDVCLQHFLLGVLVIRSENCSIISHVIDCNLVGEKTGYGHGQTRALQFLLSCSDLFA